VKDSRTGAADFRYQFIPSGLLLTLATTRAGLVTCVPAYLPGRKPFNQWIRIPQALFVLVMGTTRLLDDPHLPLR
jgi:hypothetical protein